MTRNNKSNISWDKYWQGTGNIGAYTGGGASHPALQKYWVDFFAYQKHRFISPNIVDIASGNGAILEIALSAYGYSQSKITSLDISESAIKNINRRFPKVKAVIADANTIPLESEGFQIVTSQFGVEYAGIQAIFEAARLVANNGFLGLILHIKNGSIHYECLQSIQVIKELRDSNFIPYAIDMFDAGFKAMKGADRTIYELAAKKLAPAILQLESIMNHNGKNVAGGTILSLYQGVEKIHNRIQFYTPTEVLDWLIDIDTELDGYVDRMQSMNTSAIDEEKFNQIKTQLQDLGFKLESSEKFIVNDNKLPMAWKLVAQKQSVSQRETVT